MPSGSTAEACRLLKGLLNRNVQKRLGAAKSTMFEVGGVAALKNEPFFAHLNWEQLANKQVEPPQVLSVQSDQDDLQHFHQEFLDMALPRSVVLMSKPNFPAHHVESQRFRGFSFIHDCFDLPERPDSELESYWKSIEEDALSLSDCASSKLANEASEEPLTESPAKKRPPRKRKKNKQDASGATPADSTKTFPAPAIVAQPAPSENVSSADAIALDQNESTTPNVVTERVLEATHGSLHQDKSITSYVEGIKKVVEVEDWQSVGGQLSKTERQRSLANMSTPSKNVPKTPDTEEASKSSWHASNQPSASNPSPWSRSKQPGTGAWGTPSVAAPRAPPVRPSRPPSSTQAIPSSDWRYHPMSSRRQVPFEAQQQQDSPSPPTWPSLAGKPNSPQPSVSKVSPPTKPVLKGAWASKVAR